MEEIETAEEAKANDEMKVAKYSVTMAQIAALAKEYNEVPEDLTVKANYELVKKATSHIRGLRGDVEKRRKELKADALAWGKLVDSTAKEITEKLFEIETPFATAKKDFDTAVEIEKREAALAEEKRIDGIAERIAGIKALVGADITAHSSVIKDHLAKVQEEGNSVAEWSQEFSGKAQEAITETWDKLSELFSMKLQQEQAAEKQAEAEAKRVLDEEEARKQREIEIKAEQEKIAAERAAMEAERVKMAEQAAALKAEQGKKDAAAKAEQDKKDAAQALITAELEAYSENARIAMAKKDALVEADRLKMLAEIEALKKANEVPDAKGMEEPVKSEESRESQKQEVPNVCDAGKTATGDSYRAAGKAMIKFIGNREITKALLDAIINNEVTNIKFNGEV